MIDNQMSKNTEIIKKRDASLDIMKGVAMFFVVLGHLIVNVYSPQDYFHNIVYKMAYSFHMPMFFFVSGFLAGKKKAEGFTGNYILKRSMRLVLPWLIWTFVASMISRTSLIFNLIIVPFYWFLPCLWLYNLIQFVSVRSRHFIFATAVQFAFCFVIFFLSRSYTKAFFVNLFLYCPFYFGAVIISMHKEWFNKNLIKKFLIASVVLYPLSMIFYSNGLENQVVVSILYKTGIQSNLLAKFLKCAVYVYDYYIVGALGICFYWFVCKKTYAIAIEKHGKMILLQKYLCLVSFYSMPVYILHVILLKSYFNDPLLDTLLCGALCLTVPVIVGWIIKRFRIVSEVLFGN